MSGSEELSRAKQGLNDKLYLPDESMTQNILASITRAQQERIKEGGQAWANSKGIPWAGAQNAADAFWQGRKTRRSEEEQDQAMAMRQKAMEGQDIQNQRSRGSLTEEQQKRAFLTTPDESGQTPQARMYQAELQDAEMKPQVTRHAMDLQDKNLKLNTQMTMAQLDLMGLQSRDVQEARQRQILADAIGGIRMDGSLSDAEKQSKINDLVADAKTASAINPQAVEGIGRLADAHAQTAMRQAATGSETATESQDPFRTMKKETGDVTANAALVDGLDQKIDQYKKGLRLGFIGEGLGAMGGEDPSAQSARASFADSLRDVQPRLAKSIQDTGITSALSRMIEARNTVAAQANKDWETGKSRIHPSMIQRPEYQQTSLLAAQKFNPRVDVSDDPQIPHNQPLAPSTPPPSNEAFMNQRPSPPAQSMGGAAYGAPSAPPSPQPGGGLPWDFSTIRTHDQQPAVGVPK